VDGISSSVANAARKPPRMLRSARRAGDFVPLLGATLARPLRR